MTVVVMDSKAEQQFLTSGAEPKPAAEPKPPAAKAPAAEPKPPAVNPDPAAEAQRMADEIEDTEDEQGLTPRQKREFSEQMLHTIRKKHYRQKKAEELAAQEYNRARLAEERAAAIERENQRLKAERDAAQPAPKPAEPPKREDFQNDDAYAEALIDYRVDQKLKAQEALLAERAAERRQDEIRQAAAARIDRAIELVPDFKEVVGAVDLEVPPAVSGYMAESDLFAELGYFLAQHPEQLVALAKLNPARQLVEIGKIESKLSPFAKAKVKSDPDPSSDPPHGDEPRSSTGTAPSKPRVTAPIIQPLNTGSTPQVSGSDGMKLSEHVRHVEKKYGTALTARKRH